MITQIKDILEVSIISFGKVDFRVYTIIQLLLVIIAGRLVIWGIQRVINRQITKENINPRKGYAISQIITYLAWVIIIVLALDTIGIPITVLIAGSTALFVGLGLGLQDTFKDLVAGVVILMERTLAAGDIVEVSQGLVGRVKEVGLRTTLIETREDIVIVVPNQKMTSENVINWTQNRKAVRFSIDVGVAYGSDTRLVERLLCECAKKHSAVAKKPAAAVHFTSFGNSSLDFKLLFYSSELFRIEKIKSDIRFMIDQTFRDNNITIPFPQQDIWFRNEPQEIPPKKTFSDDNA